MMFMNERECIKIGCSDVSVRERRVEKSVFVVDERKHICTRVFFQRGEQYFLSAAERGKGVNHESCARFRFHSIFSRSILRSFAMRSFLLAPILFLLMTSAGLCRLDIVLLPLIGYQDSINQKLILHRTQLLAVRRGLKR